MTTSCAHHGPLSQVRPGRAGAAARLARLFGHQRERAVHWPDRFKFFTPAQGDAYDFTVIARFTWCVTGRDHGDWLLLRTSDHRTALLERLMATVRPASRRHPPYEVAAAEREIHRALSDTFSTIRFPYPDGDIRVLAPSTRVKPADAVLEAAREAWKERQRVESAHELGTVIAQRLGVRREVWGEFLRSAEKEWLTPYAVALAQDSDKAAEIVRTMFDNRWSQAREVGDEVVRQVEDYGEADAFELMTHHDTVLGRLMDLLEVPRHASAGRSPFEERFANGSSG